MRTRDYWKAKLVAAEKEVRTLQKEIDSQVIRPGDGLQASAVFTLCTNRGVSDGHRRWMKWLLKIRERRKQRRRLSMLMKKIPYYKERIEARTKRTAFDAIQNPLV